MIDSNDLERLRDYCRLGDRRHEPVFVGREDLFAAVDEVVVGAVRHGGEGQTMCISGPPGIGKTSFIREFKSRSRNPENDRAPALVVSVPTNELNNPKAIVNRISIEVSRNTSIVERAKKYLASARLSVNVAGIASLAVQGAAASGDAQTASFPWVNVCDVAREVIENGSAVCIAVDEAQALGNHPRAPWCDIFRELHQGSGVGSAPIFAMFVGHTQTPDVIRPAVSYRYSTGNNIRMRPLSHGESIEYAHGIMEHLGLRGARKDALAEWVASECGGWPQHLRNAMAAIARSAIDANSLEIEKLDGVQIEQDLCERRKTYYQGRLSGSLKCMRRTVSALLDYIEQEYPGGADPDDVLVAMNRLFFGAGEHELARLVTDQFDKPIKWLDELVATGVLAHTAQDSDILVCPIDSMRQYLRPGKHNVRTPFPI